MTSLETAMATRRLLAIGAFVDDWPVPEIRIDQELEPMLRPAGDRYPSCIDADGDYVYIGFGRFGSACRHLAQTYTIEHDGRVVFGDLLDVERPGCRRHPQPATEGA